MSYTKNKEQLYIALEAYHGKKKEFFECERLLDEFCEIIKKEGVGKFTNDKTAPIIRKVETLLKKSIGFAAVNIMVTKSPTPSPAAYVTLQSWMTSMDPRANSFKNTLPEFAHANIIFPEITIIDYDLNGAEVMSLIIHELGHCIDATMWKYTYVVGVTYYNMFCTIKATKMNQAQAANYMMTNIIALFAAQPVIDVLISKAGPSLSNIWAKIGKTVGAPLRPIIALFNAIENALPNPWPLINLMNTVKLFKKTGPAHVATKIGLGFTSTMLEKYADSYAVAYGYGPELSSALRKIENRNGTLAIKLAEKDSSGILSTLVTMTDYMTMIMSQLVALDGHQMSISRIHSVESKLKRELAASKLDPKLKAQIMQELADVQKQISVMVDDPEEPTNKAFKLRFIMNRFISKGTNGKFGLADMVPEEWVQY